MNTYTPPADKSITIRALLMAAIADGVTRIDSPLICGDTEASLRCLAALGVKVRRSAGSLVVEGRGLRGLRRPSGPLNAGESGALSRMLAGILSGQDFPSIVSGVGSLLKRPMSPLAAALKSAGAAVSTAGGFLPVSIRPSEIRGGTVAGLESAQLKSAVLLAGLYARGPVEIREKLRTRDHTERMMRFLGGRISVRGRRVRLRPGGLCAARIPVPGDVSSAAFFIAAALFSRRPLKIDSCGLNPARLGFIKALKRMGADISIRVVREVPEPCGEICVRPSALKAVRVGAAQVPDMIDEIPTLAVAAALARGVTVIRGVDALRAKESDRIASTLALLSSLGARASYGAGSMTIYGGAPFSAAKPVETFGDHRIAMAAAVASLSCPGLEIRDPGCVNKSYPGFWKDFGKIFGPAVRAR